MQICFLNLWLIFLTSYQTFSQSKIFNFGDVHFINFSFMDYAFGVVFKNSLLSLLSQRYFLKVFPKRITVLLLTCRRMLHFELIFA